jgi:hypothetical protein
MNNLSSHQNATFEDIISAGIKLVLIPQGQKRPNRKGWNLRENIISTIDQLNKLNGMNVGLAHAYCSPNPTCAIDLDDVAQATRWFKGEKR